VHFVWFAGRAGAKALSCLQVGAKALSCLQVERRAIWAWSFGPFRLRFLT
jgi:hypothetical protein